MTILGPLSTSILTWHPTGADVMRGAAKCATQARLWPFAGSLPGLSLERTTGFEPATLALAKKAIEGSPTPLPAPSRIDAA